MLEREIGFNNQLKIFVEKCENHLFDSIPQLIIELKKVKRAYLNENETEPDFKMSKAISNRLLNTTFFRKNRKQIKRYSIACISLSAVLLVSFFSYKMFFTNSEDEDHSKDSFKLGNTTYSAQPANPSIGNHFFFGAFFAQSSELPSFTTISAPSLIVCPEKL